MWECSQPALPEIRTAVIFVFISFRADFSTAECCILGLYWAATLLDQSPPGTGATFSSESLRRRIKTWKMKLCTSSVRVNWCHITSPRWPGTRVMWWKCGPCVSQPLSLTTWAHIAACFAWKPHLQKRKQGRIYRKQKQTKKKKREKKNFFLSNVYRGYGSAFSININYNK